MPPMFLITAVSAAVAGVIGFGLAWRLQSATILEMENVAKDTRIAAQLVARQAIERATSAVITAQSNAATRNAVLRSDADASRTALDGLRQSSASALRSAASSLDACLDATATAHKLLDQCGSEYQALGERADGHASDVKTLIESWPR